MRARIAATLIRDTDSAPASCSRRAARASLRKAPMPGEEDTASRLRTAAGPRSTRCTRPRGCARPTRASTAGSGAPVSQSSSAASAGRRCCSGARRPGVGAPVGRARAAGAGAQRLSLGRLPRAGDPARGPRPRRPLEHPLCLETAPRNARADRTALTVDMWGVLNDTWLELRSPGFDCASDAPGREPRVVDQW